MRAQPALVFHTANTPCERVQAVFGDPLARIWKDGLFSLCGVTRFHRQTTGVMVFSTPNQRTAWRQEITETIRDHFPA